MMDEATYPALFAVAARCFGLIVCLPFGETIQSLPRIFLAVGCAWAILPSVEIEHEISHLSYAWEFIVGILLGAPLRFVADVGEMFGELLDTARGQTIGSVVDPLNGQAVSDLAVVCRSAIAAIALHLGALELSVEQLVQSYTMIPLGAPLSGIECAADVLSRGLSLIGVVLGISALWFAAFLMTDIVAALAARMVKGIQFSLMASIVKSLLTFSLLTLLVISSQRLSKPVLRELLLGGQRDAFHREDKTLNSLPATGSVGSP